MLTIGFLTATSAGAQTNQKPGSCTTLFTDAHTRTVGKTTWYNRQSSVENVACFGFGLNPSAHFPISWEIVCGLVAQAIGAKADTLGDFVDGACSGASLALDPREPVKYIETVCSWASDLLEEVAKPAGVAASMGCTFAPSAGTYAGGKLESAHELEVATDVIDNGRCLKYSPSHFGSPWLAVTCAPGDTGFSTLPVAPTSSTTTSSPATNSTFAIGASFQGQCTVAWPTAPTVTALNIQMTMECPNVPESQFLFTVVIFNDPRLPVTPASSTMFVIGRVVNVATSGYGFKELVVQASSIKLPQ